MARYQYAGPGPVTDPDSGEVIRPGDVCEYADEPAFGPWELLDPPEPEAREPEPEPAAEPVKPAPAPFLAAPASPEGM